MAWYIISAILFLIAIGLLVVTRIRDRRYERMRTSEAMRAEIWEEIEEEREAIETRQAHFRQALEQAKEQEKRAAEQRPDALP